jgi:hypothetical protein
MNKLTQLGNNCIIPSTRLLFFRHNVNPFKDVTKLTIINWTDMELYKNLNTYYFPNLQQLNYFSNHKHTLIDLHMIALTDFMRDSSNTKLGLYKDPRFSFNIYKSIDLFEFYFPKSRLVNIGRKEHQEITAHSKEKNLETFWTKYIKESVNNSKENENDQQLIYFTASSFASMIK